MAYQVSWIIQNRVLYIQFTDDITLDDIRDSARLIADHVEAVYTREPEIVVIGVINLREARLDTILWTAVSIVVKQIADVIDPRIWKLKTGFSVLIARSERAKTVISLILRVFSQPITTVATIEEAIAVIGAMYPELQESLETYRQENLSTGPIS